MKKYYLFTTLLSINFLIGFSQEINHKKIQISDVSTPTQEILVNLGIDLRCGAIIDEEGIHLELSAYELSLLNEHNIAYNVEIEDLVSFYENRTRDQLPRALAQLEQEKLSNQSRSYVTSTDVLSNPLQYSGCEEVDWLTPSNFNLGSMGGCMTVGEVLAELDEMRSLYPALISPKLDASSTNQTTYGNTLGSISNQWSGQSIYYVRITGDQSSPEGTKPQILYTSMIHSREVGSLMSNLFFMWYLLENYQSDSAIKHLVDNNELYFIPIVNPDGLRWNETIAPSGGGMQRKNLRVNSGDSGNTSSSNTRRGVDLNRNFDYFWGTAGTGSSGTSSSDSYRGPSAASEPETQILMDFVLARNFQTCIMNHTYSNAIPHPYGGNPSFVSNREDEMHKWHEDMTRYNRYISGATIFSPANGIADDWMLGGASDSNGSSGSGLSILATTPEHGHASEGGFWPSPSNIVPIAKRAMRIYFMNAYYGGKYARLHDLTSSNINTISSTIQFGIERLGQTNSDFNLTITPVSSNIVSITSPATQNNMAILEQRNLTASLVLNSGIQANDIIEYKVELSNDDTLFYEANITKSYQPTVLLSDNPDSDGLSHWDSPDDWLSTTLNAWSGTTSIKEGSDVPYEVDGNSILTTQNSYDLSAYNKVLVEFYTTWDLERNFDFVELLGSADGGNSWQSLCGVYNKPNATSSSNDSHVGKSSSSYAFQESNSSGRVYDGDQMGKWVMEQIIIDNDNNSFMLNSDSAQFRFRFSSDGDDKPENYSTTSEGFYFDEFKILGLNIPCDNSDSPSNLIVSAITPASAQLTWDHIPSANYDIRYRILGSSTWNTINDISANNTIISGLSPSTDYEVQVATRCASSLSSFSVSVEFSTLTLTACTGNSINSFPYLESFESGFGQWEQGLNGSEDDIDWTLHTGETLSGSTGPEVASNGVQYCYTEASTNVTPAGSPNKHAYLISPCLDFGNYEHAQISFDYHMYGLNMGSLSLQASVDNGATYTSLFEISGQQHDDIDVPWTTQTVDLSLYDQQTVKLRFVGITGSDYRSDMAIDHIRVEADELTLSIENEASDNVIIHPNPFTNTIMLSFFDDSLSSVDIELIDITGRIVMKLPSVEPSMTHKRRSIQVDQLNRLSNGTYFIKITRLDNGKQIIKRLLKK